MRILFVSDTYFPHFNGVYSFVRQLASQLKRNGHSVAVIAPSQTYLLTKSKVDDIDMYGISSLPVFFYPIRVPVPFMLNWQIRRILLEYKPDVIHIQSHFLIGKATIEVNKALGFSIIGTNHFMPENLIALLRTKKWTKQIEAMMYASLIEAFNQLILVTAPTETAAGLIRHQLKCNVHVISNGIDLNRFQPVEMKQFFRERYGIGNTPVLLFVGRIDPEKKLKDVLCAVQIALRKIDFYFVVVGKGVCKGELEKLAVELEIQHRVIFTGFISANDLPHYYRSSSCFIMASTAELQSIATMEAMASALPVVAVNAGALAELVHDGENGYLFNHGSKTDLVNCLHKVFSDPLGSASMGKRSLEMIEGHDICKSAEAFERIYLEAISLNLFKKVETSPIQKEMPELTDITEESIKRNYEQA